MSVFDVLGTIGKLALPSSLKLRTCGKPRSDSRGMVPQIEATGVFLARRRAIFQSRIRPAPGKSWRSKSGTPCLNMSSFLRTRARGSNGCESERILARAWHPRGENCEIFSIVLFHPLVFAHTVDVVPEVGFQRSWCRRKVCVTFFPKVLSLHRGELGFVRYSPANRGRRNVSHARASFSYRDSSLTGGALDDPRVVRCS